MPDAQHDGPVVPGGHCVLGHQLCHPQCPGHLHQAPALHGLDQRDHKEQYQDVTPLLALSSRDCDAASASSDVTGDVVLLEPPSCSCHRAIMYLV